MEGSLLHTHAKSQSCWISRRNLWNLWGACVRPGFCGTVNRLSGMLNGACRTVHAGRSTPNTFESCSVFISIWDSPAQRWLRDTRCRHRGIPKVLANEWVELTLWVNANLHNFSKRWPNRNARHHEHQKLISITIGAYQIALQSKVFMRRKSRIFDLKICCGPLSVRVALEGTHTWWKMQSDFQIEWTTTK